METATKKCPYCAETINAEAIKCRFCGEILDNDIRIAREQANRLEQPIYRERKWSPGVAALLSFFIPGAGQMYKGDVGTGIVWMIVVVSGYLMLIIPGVILHLICVFTASSGDPYAD